MSEFTPIIAVNGVLGASLSPLDRGLAYGDGLFETCRVMGGSVPLWDYHRERLQHGCTRLALPLDLESLHAQRDQILTEAATQGYSEGVLKLTLTRGVGGRGYRPPARPKPTLCWVYYPGEQPYWAKWEKEGVELWVCKHRLGENPVLAGLKHLSRLDYVLARAEWDDDYPEGLLLDNQGCVVEGTISNLFAFKEGRLMTPPLHLNGVAGVMRRIILEKWAPALSVPTEEVALSLTGLCQAEEVFVCNSVFGLWPVVGMSEGARFTVGPVTRKLQQARVEWLAERAQ